MSTSATPARTAPTLRELREIHHWIGGHPTPGNSGRSGDVYNPATGEVQAKVILASPADVDAAVAIATKAFPEWSSQPVLRRARVLFRFREIFRTPP